MMKKIWVKIDNFFYRNVLKNVLKTSKLGYGFVVTGAEAGANYEHIYDNLPEGKYLVGKWVDRALMNLPAVQCTRRRKEDVKNFIFNEIENNRLRGVKTRILDLASGGARYLRELREVHEKGLVESICIDKNPESIQLGKTLSQRESLENVKFVKADMFQLSHLIRFAERKNWHPNVVVASGIFIYFNDTVVQELLREIYNRLPSGGLLVFTSYEKIDSKKLMRKAMRTTTGEEWTLYYRKPDYWRSVLFGIGFCNVFISIDQWQMNNVCMARKP